MPWYTPWSDHISKSVCKYLLQRYLGQFLEEKLTLDRLTVDLYKGIGVISDVVLDVQALNEVAEQQNVPFEFTDGFFEKMSVSIPWSSILSDSISIQVEGLSLTIKKTERDKTRVSMIESMWSSMTSSMQLAADCLKNERDNSNEGGQTFEGIESFAQTIDSILSRIKFKFFRTVIRLEEISEIVPLGVALEIKIKLMEYFDEATAEELNAKTEHQHTAFSTKKIYLEGVTLHSDELSIESMTDSTVGFTTENEEMKAQNTLESEKITGCILIGKFAGRQEVTMKFKQDGMDGPKVDIQISLGALNIFLSPHQAHSMMDLIDGMSSSTQEARRGIRNQCLQKPMEESDFRKIEHELQMNLDQVTGLQSKGLSNQGWANTCLDMSDDFAPLHNAYRLNDSVISSTGSLSSSVMSMSSRSSHCQSSYYQPKRKSESGGNESDPNAIVIHFHILLSSLSIVLLHEDILTVSPDSHNTTKAKSSYEEMRRVANEFFDKLAYYVASGYGNKDFEKARDVFSNICQLNHLRLTAAPVIIEGSETSTTNTSVIKGKCTTSSMEVLECLLEKNPNTDQKIVEYVELLKFKTEREKEEPFSQAIRSAPKVTINFRLSHTNSHVDKGRRYVQPKSEFMFDLQPFETEIDITIADRISALLNPDYYFSRKTNGGFSSYSTKPFSPDHIRQVVDSISVPNVKQNVKLTSPFITIKLRFPIPDLRPIHDMDKPPWWKRSVRKDILYLDVTDLTLTTVFNSLDPVSKYEFQFRDIIVKFKESDSDQLIEFAKGSTASYCDTLDDSAGFGWPRLVVQIYPKMNSPNLEGCDDSISTCKISGPSLGYQSVVSTLERTTKKEHSPFSCKKVIHESDTPHCKGSSPERDGEELIIPGDSAEIADFIDVASLNTRVKLDITLPTGSVVLPSKHLYEVIYNRISNDLLLWEPSAPIRHNFSANSQFQQSVDGFDPTFNLCKSTVQCDSESESDSDLESQDGIFYSVYEQKQRHKKKQLLESNNLMGQSKVVLKATVMQGMLNLYSPVRDSQGNVIPRQHGHLNFSFEDGNLFLVSGYKGKSDLDYFCVQVNHFLFYHNGLVSDAIDEPVLYSIGNSVPSHLDLTVKKTERCALIDQSTSVGTGTGKSLDMLTVSLRVQKQLAQGLKTFRVAIGIREATLRHKVCKGPNSWFTQLVDFFDVTDYPIAGYDPCSVLSEINVHLWNCSVDYRPLHIPIRSVLTIGNFNISSNIAAQTSSSTLRFIAEDAAFFIADKTTLHFRDSFADLKNDYVCVMELGLFELSLRLSEKSQVNPKIDLRASANVAHIWTCSDSARALTDLLMYFASDGDLNYSEAGKEESEFSSLSSKSESDEQILIKTEDIESVHSLSKSQVALVNDLMEEAMKESKLVEPNSRKDTDKPGKIIYFERGDNEEIKEETESHSLGTSELVTDANGYDFEKDDSWEEEFCIVHNEAGMDAIPKKGLPEVRNLINAPVRLVDNHFSIPLGKADLLQSPKHYPKPVLRYMLREMSLVWHMYGGSDFNTKPSTPAKPRQEGSNFNSESVPNSETVVTFSKNSQSGVNFKAKVESSIPWKQRGGPKRRHDILMELQFNKVRFQHEVYPDNTTEASRQVLLIQDVELRDRLATSTINKFLYQYSSEAKPKQSQAPMVVIKSVLMRSDPKINAQECCLKVSLLPLRLNIDQDSLLFLYKFFTELSGDGKEDEEEGGSRSQTPKHQIPVMTVNVKGSSQVTKPDSQPLLIDLEEQNQKENLNTKNKRKGFVSNSKTSPQPIFIRYCNRRKDRYSFEVKSLTKVYSRCFIFSPEVHIKLDYQGKRVDMSHGSLTGILMGLGQLNNSELKLRKITHRHGLLGFDKLVNFVLTEWAHDIKKNQLPSLLGGVGPMHSLVQLIQGIRDLFWMPIEQYQKDGRLVRGFQRGANSFTTSTAMASLELISRLIQIIQATAETAYDVVSPGPSVRNSRRNGKGQTKRYSQPADIREGMAIAYLVVKEGIGETAETLVRVASKEHEQKGVTGAVGGVLRQIPPTVVKPIILATEATSNVIGGMRSQLVPDARKEAVEKWRKEEP
ncbi:hypothetical protein RUM44_000567 [Polyplax serrata]|uniref:Autophagy-related protein 2 n=1 Tax=Polyplax serrata TaxID=468196 RepID=A0ABR1B5T3_POLSC